MKVRHRNIINWTHWKLRIKSTEKTNDENIYPSHYDMRFVKPLDEKLLHKILKSINSY